ncbi:GON-4-like protein isoform X2 [Heptranchias perlo]|uniref:GON-4-like protein isoform X2 n=1 Tax=Heptranchias perlo TaxID=212740 RepID=UPI0035596975
MLPAQKRKAPPSPDSPQRTKSARTDESSPQPAGPSQGATGSGGDCGKGDGKNSVVAIAPPATPAVSGNRGDAGRQDLGQEGQTPRAASEPQSGGEQDRGVSVGRLGGDRGAVGEEGTRQPDEAMEGTDGETVGEAAAGVSPRDDAKGDLPPSGQALAAPAVTSVSGARASPGGPSERPEELAGPVAATESGRSLSLLSGTPEVQKEAVSDDEKDEGERNLVVIIEEGESETKKKRKKALKREKKMKEGKSAEEARPDCEIQLDDNFERALEDGAKHHNLTAINVRNILHEVITNEHVVAMMKAAINDTEQQHVFEPKMTRSKLKEVVEKGVVPPTWNISPIKKSKECKAPQFIDIPLEEEDSSDEEYRPEEEEEDETAEESFLESDAESTTSSPAGGRRPKSRLEVSEILETDEESASVGLPCLAGKVKGTNPAVRHLSVEVVPMGPPPLPPKANKDSSFMEKLHAVDEELASNEVCMDSYQSLDDRLIAYRTRSKWSLNNVSLGLLEAELKAPDITPDMYDQGTQDDVYWQSWMKAVMNDLDYEDDEDDPEYNFLEDLDEPDMEDFRNDRAVRITKKEVNELMEELFETFQDEMGVPDVEEEEGGDDEAQEQLHNTFNTPQAMRFEEPLANILTEQHRTVKAQIEQLRQRKAKQQASAAEVKPTPRRGQQPETLSLDQGQKLQLQQQMQQHVQLLTQVHLLTSINSSLDQEAETSKLFLKELASFAEKANEIHLAKGPGFRSMFSPCNLRESLELAEEFGKSVKPRVKIAPPRDERKMSRRFDESNYLPREVAWILATGKVFMYPELLPHSALQPKHPKDKAWFSKGEDNLLVLGLKHFEETDFPKPLISQYLMPPKTYHQLSVRIKNLSVSRAPDNVIKLFKKRKIVLSMPSPFTAVGPEDMCPPIEREENKLPYWLQRSLPAIRRWFQLCKEEAGAGGQELGGESGPDTSPVDTEPPDPAGGRETEMSRGSGAGEERPLLIPDGVALLLKPKVSHLTKKDFRRRKRRPSAVKPVLIHPAAPTVKRSALRQPGPLLPPKHKVRPPRLIQPAPSVQPVSFIQIPPVLQPTQTVQPLGVVKPPPAPWLSPGPAARKPRGRRPGRNDPKGRRPRPTKTVPVIQAPVAIRRAPVILTVPAGVKLVSLGSGCNVIHPIPGALDTTGQTLRVATVVVSPTAFACRLAAPAGSLICAGRGAAQPGLAPAPPPAAVEGQTPAETSPATGGENPPGSSDACDKRAGDSESKSSSPHLSGQEPPHQSAKGETADPARASDEVTVKESPSPQSCDSEDVEEACIAPSGERMAKVERAEEMDTAGDEGLPERPSVGAKEPTQVSEQPVSEGETAKDDQGSPGSENSAGTPEEEEPLKTTEKQQVILELGQELDVETTVENPTCSTRAAEEDTENSTPQPDTGALPEDPFPKGQTSAIEGGSEESRSPPAQTKVDEEDMEKPEKPDEVNSGEEASVVSPEEVKTQMEKSDKDGQEEDDDEDFDDLTQDEEDEEVLSSASEESALSVPELQETMEKLTWLASERRLSQEADSEEENSQEENSEPEEEEEGEGLDLLQKEEDLADEAVGEMAEKEMRSSAFPADRGEVDASSCLRGESRKLSGKGKASCRTRAKRGRRRVSKDTSKLLLLYDEDILNNDPLREQKDMAFAQAYLSKVREALQDVPGKYEEFLRILYDFETNPDQRTAVDLYGDLCDIIREWPQLLKDFAAFLLPEQALQCGLFEEQQAFDKSRKFLRQLEICFAENPSHHQKIIKALQSCMVCSPPDVAELKVQVWQLLKGHHHLQDEFSLFFEQLRPPASRMSDFEEVNWTEDKEYEFDGFEEVVLPDLEEEEELQKMPPPPRNKRRREGHTHDKSLDAKTSKSKDSVSTGAQEDWSPQPGLKDPGKGGDPTEEYPEQREDSQAPGSNSEDGSPRGAVASGSNTCPGLNACEESILWRNLPPPANRCRLEEGDENENRVSQTGNEVPTSPLGSADETQSPSSEGESGDIQGLEEMEMAGEVLSDGSSPPLNPISNGRSQELDRRRGSCSGNTDCSETGARAKERESASRENGQIRQAAGAQEVSEGERRAARGTAEKGSPPQCASPGVSEAYGAEDKRQARGTRNPSNPRLEQVSTMEATAGSCSHCIATGRSESREGATRGRSGTERGAGHKADLAVTMQDGGAAPVRVTSPSEMGARRGRRPDGGPCVLDTVTGSTYRERFRHTGGRVAVKFASASAQVRFMTCQKLADLPRMDVELTLAHRGSRDGCSQRPADRDPPAARTAGIPHSRGLWETGSPEVGRVARAPLPGSGGTGETMECGREQPFLGSCSELGLHQTESRDECTGEGDEQYGQSQAAVCAMNSRLSSTGERVVLWTREADRAILTACQERGANQETFSAVAQQLNSKSAQEVSRRFRELMRLFHTSGDASTDEEEDAFSNSNPDLLSDLLVSDEEQD